jgi:HAD superfamily hydrolase (TIGR01458 family)
MAKYQGVIFDIDGVLTYQDMVFPGAPQVVDLLRRQGLTLRFLTNSTLQSRRSCAARLRAVGFQVDEAEVLTASYLTALYLRQIKPRSVWVLVERQGVEEFVDFTQDLENPAYIVIGDNRSNFDFVHLNQALRLLRKGAKLIGMIPELLDTTQGDLELNVGSWVHMLELASGVPATYIGKPHRYAYEYTLSSMGLDKRQVIAVGDRTGTDIQGANDFGTPSVLVRTGEFAEHDLSRTAWPDFIIDSIQELPAILLGAN